MWLLEKEALQTDIGRNIKFELCNIINGNESVVRNLSQSKHQVQMALSMSSTEHFRNT